MADVVTVVSRALADDAEQVQVSETDHQGTCLIEVSAAPRDVGRIIGRQGRTIAAIRTLAGVCAETLGTPVTVEIRDEPGPR